MTILLAGVLGVAAFLLLKPPGGAAGRFRRAVASPAAGAAGWSRFSLGINGRGRSGGRGSGPARSERQQAGLSLTLMVQHLAALLKGGRTPSRLWDELQLVHAARPGYGRRPGTAFGGREAAEWGTVQACGGLSAGSLMTLGSARAAAFRGSPVSEAIRHSVRTAFPRGGREARIWCELAACFDIAEASGCPLADILARFAAQLEAEDDAEAARQTALAGPKATVSLLTWLPLMGLGLGTALGVDPLAVLLGTPPGMAALAAGAALTVAGRLWSARLVRAAAGAG